MMQSITHAFKEVGELLQKWRDITAELFPNQQDLFGTIPMPAELTLAKAAKKGIIMTDTCNTTCKLRRLLIEQIKAIAKEEGMSSDQSATFEGDCWQHLHNIWFGGMVKQLSKTLATILEDDISKIPSIYRITTDIEALL